MWRSVGRLIDPLLLRFYRRMQHLEDAARLRRQRSYATIDDTAVMHAESAIDNHQGTPGAVIIGAHTHVRGQLLTFWNAGQITLGEWVYVGEGTRIWSQNSVRIGNHVLISHLVDIHDTDSHPVDWRDRRREAEAVLNGIGYRTTSTESAPVVIEDDVWIGFKAVILKGVRVGRGAIVAACSVVTKDVPSFSVVAGNPAKVIREVTSSSQAS
jgi:acetyltransferase-like isoleucine patch superfamily enzyme